MPIGGNAPLLFQDLPMAHGLPLPCVYGRTHRGVVAGNARTRRRRRQTKTMLGIPAGAREVGDPLSVRLPQFDCHHYASNNCCKHESGAERFLPDCPLPDPPSTSDLLVLMGDWTDVGVPLGNLEAPRPGYRMIEAVFDARLPTFFLERSNQAI